MMCLYPSGKYPSFNDEIYVMSQKIVRNSSGQIIYRTNTHMGITKVYDDRNRLLGWCQHGQTRNAQGLLIAQGEVPGILVQNS